MLFLKLIDFNTALASSSTLTILIIDCGVPFMKVVLVDSNIIVLFGESPIIHALVLRGLYKSACIPWRKPRNPI